MHKTRAYTQRSSAACAQLGDTAWALPGTIISVGLEGRLLHAFAATEGAVQRLALALALGTCGACGARVLTPGQHGTPLPVSLGSNLAAMAGSPNSGYRHIWPRRKSVKRSLSIRVYQEQVLQVSLSRQQLACHSVLCASW